MHINGQIKITGGNPDTDKILVSSDNTGLAVWKSATELGVAGGTQDLLNVLNNGADASAFTDDVILGGGLQLGTSTSTVPGTMQWDGTEVSYYNGTTWEQISGLWDVGLNDSVYSNENIGIGTNDPTEKLEVDGNIKLTGELYGLNDKKVCYEDGTNCADPELLKTDEIVMVEIPSDSPGDYHCDPGYVITGLRYKTAGTNRIDAMYCTKLMTY